VQNLDQIQPEQTSLPQTENEKPRAKQSVRRQGDFKPLADLKTLGDFKTLGAMRDSFYELMEQDLQGFRY
jgi:hypothetical protein